MAPGHKQGPVGVEPWQFLAIPSPFILPLCSYTVSLSIGGLFLSNKSNYIKPIKSTYMKLKRKDETKPKKKTKKRTMTPFPPLGSGWGSPMLVFEGGDHPYLRITALYRDRFRA